MFDLARKVADAVLYEGYVLYPYRASANKNQSRWQWGVVVPRAYHEAGNSDAWDQQTEVLIEGTDNTVMHLQLRFLQLQARTVEQAVDGEFRAVSQVEVGDDILVTWDEGVEREIDTEVRLGDLRDGTREIPVELSGGRDVETVTDEVRIVRERWPISARILLSAEWLAGPYGVVKLQVRLENVTPWENPSQDRDAACRRALVATHTLIDVGGRFVSLLDPPEWASGYAASCENIHTWPVLVEEENGDVVLSSPIILYDYPSVAPESPGDLCDATEIDEILTLRTMTLTEEEKREARATDPRARQIIERTDEMPQEVLDRLHGAIRYMRDATGGAEELSDQPERPPWWDPGADSSVSPETDRIWVAGVSVGRGTRVRLRPGVQRADAQDMFLQDRIATVEAVLFSVDDDSYLAVTLEDDPMGEMMAWHGRYLYFSPDEVEPLSESAGGERP
jgi:hypothetical protein